MMRLILSISSILLTQTHTHTHSSQRRPHGNARIEGARARKMDRHIENVKKKINVLV